jgi:hypothetical protein
MLRNVPKICQENLRDVFLGILISKRRAYAKVQSVSFDSFSYAEFLERLCYLESDFDRLILHA